MLVTSKYLDSFGVVISNSSPLDYFSHDDTDKFWTRGMDLKIQYPCLGGWGSSSLC